jgi:3',5'-cyclic AMP phosphodiesterase CpdA
LLAADQALHERKTRAKINNLFTHMANNLLTWIHLSDLHMESADSFNRKVVLDALWKDIKRLIDGGLQPDFIAFTGDTAFHGLPEEYKLAQELFFEPLLAITTLPKDRLFVVPGNHDVNRRRTELIGNPLPSLRSEDDIRKVLESDDKREVFTSPLAGYRSFEDSYLDVNMGKTSLVSPSSNRIVVGEWKISIVTLNSAWLSGFNRNAAGEIDDCAHLAIGELQVRNAFASDAETHFHIVLVHHPFDWLLEFDRFVVKELIARERSLVLHGHLHRPDAQLTSTLAGELITVPAGSVFDNRHLPNAYNLVQVDLKTGSGTIYFRRYNDRRGEWQKDLDSTGEVLDGRVQFKLPASWRLWQTGDVAPEKETRRVTDYSCIFTKDCKREMKSLGLSESDVLERAAQMWSLFLSLIRVEPNLSARSTKS